MVRSKVFARRVLEVNDPRRVSPSTTVARAFLAITALVIAILAHMHVSACADSPNKPIRARGHIERLASDRVRRELHSCVAVLFDHFGALEGCVRSRRVPGLFWRDS